MKCLFFVDGKAAVRDAVGLLFQAEAYAVETYESAPAFLAGVKQNQDGCVVADVRMPHMNGLQLIAKMKQKGISIPVIFLTGHADVRLAVEAMTLGAADLIEKPFEPHGLLSSVSATFDCSVTEEESRIWQSRFATLTLREQEIIDLLLKVQSSKAIAHDLGISIRTVEVHRANIMTKTRARNLAELIKMVLPLTGQRA